MNRETLFEKYLQGQLTEKEQQEFETLLRNDLDFKEEVEFQTDVKRAVASQEEKEFIEILSDFELENEKKKYSIKSTRIKWLVAASILFICGITYFFTANQESSSQDLFVQNFKPYRNVVNPIVRGEDTQSIENKAFSAYQTGDYEDAIFLFTKLYISDEQSYFLFYKANALIQLNRAEEAIPLLQQYAKTLDSLSDKSFWYLAMAYLQLDDKENAKKMLNLNIEKNKYKVKEAKKLLKKLD